MIESLWLKVCDWKFVTARLWPKVHGLKSVTESLWLKVCDWKLLTESLWQKVCNWKSVTESSWPKVCDCQVVGKLIIYSILWIAHMCVWMATIGILSTSHYYVINNCGSNSICTCWYFLAENWTKFMKPKCPIWASKWLEVLKFKMSQVLCELQL